MNSILEFQATDHRKVVKFPGIVVDRLLSDEELNDMRAQGTAHCAPFVSSVAPTLLRSDLLRRLYVYADVYFIIFSNEF